MLKRDMPRHCFLDANPTPQSPTRFAAKFADHGRPRVPVSKRTGASTRANALKIYTVIGGPQPDAGERRVISQVEVCPDLNRGASDRGTLQEGPLQSATVRAMAQTRAIGRFPLAAQCAAADDDKSSSVSPVRGICRSLEKRNLALDAQQFPQYATALRWERQRESLVYRRAAVRLIGPPPACSARPIIPQCRIQKRDFVSMRCVV